MDKKKENRKIRRSVIILLVITATVITGMIALKKYRSNENISKISDQTIITIGFSQVGGESGWRTGNSVSMKNTFSESRGYDLIFDDAQQRQEQQIKAIRSFIQQGVDYIILAPVIETGWDTALEEAGRMNIPVIIVDRRVKVEDEELYVSWIGSDFYAEGKKACAWMEAYAKQKGKSDLNIVHIQGTKGSTAQQGRTQALEEAIQSNGWTLLGQQSGEFTKAKAQEVMESFLNQYEDIDVVYCENDEEALGAIEAIHASGRSLGPNGGISVISFDATKEGLQAVKNGEIVLDVECNPMLGEMAEKVVKWLEDGSYVQKEYYTEGEIYTCEEGISDIEVDGKGYVLHQVTEQMIQERVY